MTELNFPELAKQGNPEAIASFLSQRQLEEITVTVNLNGDCLDIIIDGSPVPAQDKSVEFVRTELTALQPDSIRLVKVDGREIGQLNYAWSEEFTLDGQMDGKTFAQQNLPEELSSNIMVANSSNNMETVKNIEAIQPEITGFENRLRSTFIVVGIVTGILAIAVAAFVGKMLNEPAATAGQNLEATPNVATAPDPFRDAVNSAVKAADLGRAAKTKEEWNIVANRWQEAVSLMRRVPPSSPNHEVAVTKVAEYQKYLIYAQESAVTLPSPTSLPATAEKEAAEKADSKKSNSEKEAADKANSKKSNSKKESAEKADSKKSNSKKESAEKAEPKKPTPEKESTDKKTPSR